MKSLNLIVAAPLCLWLGCGNPADNVPAADVRAATNAPAQAPAEAVARTFTFGPESSTIQFVGSKVTGKHEGGFQKFTGELAVQDGQLAGAGNKVVIDMTSVWSDNDRLTGHLKSPDFFDVAKFPTATFVSTAVEQSGTNSIVTGNLTLHGVTKQISFPAAVSVSDAGVSVAAQFFLNRFDFDIKYPGRANDLIRQEVVLKLNVKAAPGKADFAATENPATPAAASN